MSNTIKVNYYDQFKCIADKCSLSCCQEWRIAVDDETHQKWQGVQLQGVTEAGKNKEPLELCSCVKKDENGYVVALKQDQQCPFLNQKKLCNLVIELGEAYLSDTCTTFPRQINEFGERTEYSLASCCPAVVDLLNENEGKLQFQQEGSSKQSDEVLMAVRDMLIAVMEEESYSVPERLMMLFYALLDIQTKKKLTQEQINSHGVKKYLEPVVEAIRNMKFDLMDTFFERNELFLDIVENYRKQKLYVNYIEEISVLAESLEEEYSDEELLKKLEDFEAQLIPYEKLFKNYLVAELFGNSLMPDMTLEDLIIAFEWITLEYSVIKQGIFLKWLSGGSKEMTYTMVRDYITVISRITGYDHSDIKEYLENSFESIIWEWGYLALVVGHEKI